MSTEIFLQFWHSNLNLIIGLLVVSVFVLIGAFLFLEFMKEKDIAEGKATGDFKQIEESLKKLLENTVVKAAPTASTSTGDTAAEGEATEGGVAAGPEVEELKKLLEEKDELITKLKEEGGAAPAEDGGGGGGGASKELKEKVKDLEARLAEYEIIEDDIADLSMYKEENAQLKDELEELKKQGPVAAAPAPPPPAPEPTSAPAAEVTEPEPAPAPATEPAAEVAAVPEPESAAEPVAESTPPVTEPVADPVPAEPAAETADTADAADVLSDDIMAEFAAAVEEQKSTESGSTPPQPERAEVTEAPAQEEPAAVEEPVSDNLMDEFAAAVEEQQAATSEPAPAPVEEPPPPAPEPEAVEEPVSDDLMEEFSAAVEEQQAVTEPTPVPTVAPVSEDEISLEGIGDEPGEEKVEAAQEGEGDPLGGVDTDAMLGEIDQLNASLENDDGSSVLGMDVDTDKMLSESDELNAAVGNDS